MINNIISLFSSNNLFKPCILIIIIFIVLTSVYTETVSINNKLSQLQKINVQNKIIKSNVTSVLIKNENLYQPDDEIIFMHPVTIKVYTSIVAYSKKNVVQLIIEKYKNNLE